MKFKYILFQILMTLFYCQACIHQNHNNQKASKESIVHNALNSKDRSKKVYKKDLSIEDSILDEIYSFPEVTAKEIFIDSLTNHKNGISMIILKRPSEKEPYYWVQVGYDNAIRFEAYFNFYVYTKGLEIRFFDPIRNKILSLKEWRKEKSKCVH